MAAPAYRPVRAPTQVPTAAALGTTEYAPVWLPYGSTSSTVVFRNSLTAALAAGAAPGYSSITVALGDGSGPEHSASNGMRGAQSGGTTASNYVLTGWPGELEDGGQMSFEVSTAWLCQGSNQGNGHGGDALSGAQTCIGWSQSANANSGSMSLYRGSGGSGLVALQRASTAFTSGCFSGWTARSAQSGKFHSYGKPANGFTRVNIGWYDDNGTGRMVVAVDGFTVLTADRSDTGLFEILCLGARVNAFGGFLGGLTPMTGASHWLRNMQVSTLAPTIPTVHTGALKDIAIIGDSITVAASFESVGDCDNNIDARILRALEAKGVRPNSLYRVSGGGHYLTDALSSPSISFTHGRTATMTVSSGSTAADMRGLVKALGPTGIVIAGGSNDVGGGATATQFRNACRDHIEYFTGRNGNSAPSVMPTVIWFDNIVDRGTNWSAGNRTTAASYRTEINGLQAWFDAAYGPGTAANLSVSIRVIDTFNGMGGTASYTGKIDADEVHPSYAGHYFRGDAIGAALAAAA